MNKIIFGDDCKFPHKDKQEKCNECKGLKGIYLTNADGTILDGEGEKPCKCWYPDLTCKHCGKVGRGVPVKEWQRDYCGNEI